MRYEHLADAIGEDNVEKLKKSTVTIIGLGGIGSTLADLLVRAGVGCRIIEKGRVDEGDLDRLSIFSSDDISKFKATQAKKILGKINPEAVIKCFNEEINKETLFLVESDLILDCTTHPDLSKDISEYAAKKKIPCLIGNTFLNKSYVACSLPGDKPAFDQFKGIKIDREQPYLPVATKFTAHFMFIKALKILTNQKPKKGIVIYDVMKQQFEDKKGKKK